MQLVEALLLLLDDDNAHNFNRLKTQVQCVMAFGSKDINQVQRTINNAVFAEAEHVQVRGRHVFQLQLFRVEAPLPTLCKSVEYNIVQ